MNYGDIYWVNLPDQGGREQRGRRPSIIFQDTSPAPGHWKSLAKLRVGAQGES